MARDSTGANPDAPVTASGEASCAAPSPLGEASLAFAIASADGQEAHSSEAVRHRIKQMIDAESADDVLSDDKLVEKLRSEGIDIARRTVAKYREALRIPSSVQRRRDKRLFERMGGTI